MAYKPGLFSTFEKKTLPDEITKGDFEPKYQWAVGISVLEPEIYPANKTYLREAQEKLWFSLNFPHFLSQFPNAWTIF